MCSLSYDTIKDFFILGGWGFIILGWYITNIQANQRENRKELRAEIDACCKMAAELLDESQTYYTSSPTDNEDSVRAARIRFKLHRLISRCENIQSKHSEVNMRGACGQLMDAISDGDFESKQRIVLNLYSDRILEIESSTHLLMDKLEEGFTATFYKR